MLKVVTKKMFTKLEEERLQLRLAIKKLEKNISHLDASVNYFQKILAEKGKEITKLYLDNNAKAKEIVHLRNHITDLIVKLDTKDQNIKSLETPKTSPRKQKKYRWRSVFLRETDR